MVAAVFKLSDVEMSILARYSPKLFSTIIHAYNKLSGTFPDFISPA
jgi:CRISPR/Cas system CSM-associated protein Csm4 (group 5 of RAMP superfamily)